MQTITLTPRGASVTVNIDTGNQSILLVRGRPGTILNVLIVTRVVGRSSQQIC